jgi:hypothetical protein
MIAAISAQVPPTKQREKLAELPAMTEDCPP